MKSLKLPSPASVVASLALLVALGTATASALFIPPNSVGSRQIDNNSISFKDLGRNSVDTAELIRGAITPPIIGFGAVTGPKLSFNSVSSANIKTDAVGSSEIAPDAVGPDQVEDVDVTDDVLNAGWSSKFSATTPGHTVDAEGVVHLVGVVAPTDPEDTGAALNLPAEASPPYDIELPVVGACGGAPTVVPAYIQRDDGSAAAGGVFFSPPPGGCSYYHLHGISFVP